jgi:hypothetical protein|tara:strand:- start:556 stop:714 length:159 start_codon:yes stop_codon:yes gene_type:complete
VRETHRNVPDIGELRKNEEEKHNGTWEKFLYKHQKNNINFDTKRKLENRMRR